MNNFNSQNLAWDKMQGLIPAIVQDADTGSVLMLAYMNPEALEQTLKTQELTFFSRSKQRLWTKGETSGNKLKLVTIQQDCDQDTLLIQARPTGPACHTGADTCFGAARSYNYMDTLEMLIAERKNADPSKSYTAKLFAEGVKRIAQKVGEEGVEVALAAVAGDNKELMNEVADLLFHALVLLQAKNLPIKEVIRVLQDRRKNTH